MKSIEEIIQGCIKGDIHSQTKLYNCFVEKMFLVCLQYCNNREEAEEVLQEGFMKVFQFLHQYKNEGSFEGWMRKIMINCALRKYRSKQFVRPVVEIETTEIVVLRSPDFGHEDLELTKIDLLTLKSEL